MNDNFKIPDQSSLFNIKNLYNQFIEHVGNDGFENIIINPDMSKTLINSSGDQQKAGWEFQGTSTSWTGSNVIINDGGYIRQDICPKLENNVYTITLDIKINHNLKMSLYGHQVGLNNYEPSIIDLDNPTPENPIQGLFKTIEPRFDEFNSPIRFQVAFSFSASSIPYPLNIKFKKNDKRWIKSSIIHDYLYDEDKLSRVKCDWIFLKAMKVEGFGLIGRWIFYISVRIFGGAYR